MKTKKAYRITIKSKMGNISTYVEYHSSFAVCCTKQASMVRIGVEIISIELIDN